MQYAIYYQGNQQGSLTLEPEGLYYRLSGLCEEPGQGVWRLWACFAAESRLVGVCFPQTGGLKLERRVSRHGWSVLPDCFVLGKELDGFRPWRGTLEGQEIPDGMLRQEAGGALTLAIFAPPEDPVPLAEYVSLMQESTLGERPCLLLPLSDGLPKLPQESAPATQADASEPQAYAQAGAAEPQVYAQAGAAEPQVYAQAGAAEPQAYAQAGAAEPQVYAQADASEPQLYTQAGEAKPQTT